MCRNLTPLRTIIAGPLAVVAADLDDAGADRESRRQVRREGTRRLRLENRLIALGSCGQSHSSSSIRALPGGGTIDDLIAEGTLHATCGEAFKIGKGPGAAGAAMGTPLRLYQHQVEAIRTARGEARSVGCGDRAVD